MFGSRSSHEIRTLLHLMIIRSILSETEILWQSINKPINGARPIWVLVICLRKKVVEIVSIHLWNRCKVRCLGWWLVCGETLKTVVKCLFIPLNSWCKIASFISSFCLRKSLQLNCLPRDSIFSQTVSQILLKFHFHNFLSRILEISLSTGKINSYIKDY